MQGINFIAIDFETATGKHTSICEAGICVVRDGKIVETRSWLVRPQGNRYSYWNMQIMVFARVTRLILRNFQKYGQTFLNISKTFPYLWPTMPHSIWVVSVTHWNSTAYKSQKSHIIVLFVRHVGSMISVATVWIIFATSSRYLPAPSGRR